MTRRTKAFVFAGMAMLGFAWVGSALAEPANPFELQPPDPFKQDALPLPPRAAPADRGREPGSAETPAPPPAAAPSSDDMPSEDQVYAVYQRGLFVEAFSLATQRAAAGDPQAMTLVGRLYEAGQGIPGDPAKAAVWYDLAAKRGDREGQVALAMLYLNGDGVARDKRRAMQLFQAAADQNQPTALFNLAQLYLEGEVVRSDPAKALELMHRAAEQGSAEAAYAYAQMLDDTDDPSKVADVTHWLGVAAASGHVAAEVEYAIRLANGRGVEKNLDLAVRYLKRAAWSGNSVAQNRLAYLSLTGSGMPYNPIEAAKWHLIAKAGGHPDLELDGFLATLKPEELAEARNRAVHWPEEPLDPMPAGFAPRPANVPAALPGPLEEPHPPTPAPQSPSPPPAAR